MLSIEIYNLLSIPQALIKCEGSKSVGYQEDYYLLGYDAVYSDRSLPVLWRKMLPSLRVEG
jgi:hypothetical protein